MKSVRYGNPSYEKFCPVLNLISLKRDVNTKRARKYKTKTGIVS